MEKTGLPIQLDSPLKMKKVFPIIDLKKKKKNLVKLGITVIPGKPIKEVFMFNVIDDFGKKVILNFTK